MFDLENRVLERWRVKKIRLDQCHQFTLIEGAAHECLEWLKNNGDEYLKACGANVGSSRAETEALLKRHTAFEDAPKFKVITFIPPKRIF